MHPEKRSFLLRLQKRMEVRGLDQKELADAVGVAEGTVSRWFNNDKFPKRTNLIKLADVLGCSPSWLQFGQELPSDTPAKSDIDSKTTNICKITHSINKHQAQLTEWIELQEEPEKYWTVLSWKAEKEFPAFAEFLKKTDGYYSANG